MLGISKQSIAHIAGTAETLAQNVRSRGSASVDPIQPLASSANKVAGTLFSNTFSVMNPRGVTVVGMSGLLAGFLAYAGDSQLMPGSRRDPLTPRLTPNEAVVNLVLCQIPGSAVLGTIGGGTLGYITHRLLATELPAVAAAQRSRFVLEGAIIGAIFCAAYTVGSFGGDDPDPRHNPAATSPPVQNPPYYEYRSTH